MDKESKIEMQGIISRVGGIDSDLSSGLQFMLENNKEVFVVQLHAYDKRYLIKSGDKVKFIFKKKNLFNNRFNVDTDSFICINLNEDLGIN